MYYKYNIDDLKYIESLKHNRKAVVYYDQERKKYVDVNSNTVASNHNQRLYDEKNIRLIGSLDEVLSYYDMWVLLIDSNGKKNTKINTEIINGLVAVFEKISSLDDIFIMEIDYISNLVTDICVSNLILSKNKKSKNNDFNLVMDEVKSWIPEEKETNLRRLLLNYIFIDTAINGITERKLIIRKEKGLIDYKVLRILKYLGININVEDIPNFTIKYNLEGINYCDSNGNETEEQNLSKKEVEKVKKLVDKRAI